MKALLAIFLLLPGMVAAEPLRVVAVHSVLADFTRILGGEHVVVTMPVEEGRDPTLWRPGISEITEIQKADLILLNGADFAVWTSRTSLPRARTVVTTKGLETEFITTDAAVTHSHGPDGEHSHTGVAAFTWLDMTIAAKQAEAIDAALARRIDGYSGNVEALLASLSALNERAATLAARVDAPILTSHPRYEYFARANGLEVIALNWAAGSDPKLDDLVEPDTILSRTPGTLFFWESAPTEAGKAALVERGLTGVLFETGANTDTGFVDLMTRNLDALEAALNR